MFEGYTERARRLPFFGRYDASQCGSITIEPDVSGQVAGRAVHVAGRDAEDPGETPMRGSRDEQSRSRT